MFLHHPSKFGEISLKIGGEIICQSWPLLTPFFNLCSGGIATKSAAAFPQKRIRGYDHPTVVDIAYKRLKDKNSLPGWSTSSRSESTQHSVNLHPSDFPSTFAFYNVAESKSIDSKVSDWAWSGLDKGDAAGGGQVVGQRAGRGDGRRSCHSSTNGYSDIRNKDTHMSLSDLNIWMGGSREHDRHQ